MSAITPQTTVIVLGDARSNNLDPRADIVRRIAERSKLLVWLNPEGRMAWGCGRFGDAALFDLLHRRPTMRDCKAARNAGVGYRGELSVMSFSPVARPPRRCARRAVGAEFRVRPAAFRGAQEQIVRHVTDGGTAWC